MPTMPTSQQFSMIPQSALRYTVPSTRWPLDTAAPTIMHSLAAQWRKEHPALGIVAGSTIRRGTDTFAKYFAGLPQDEKHRISAVARQRWDAIAGRTVNIQDTLDRLGDQLVRGGLIAPEAYNALIDNDPAAALAARAAAASKQAPGQALRPPTPRPVPTPPPVLKPNSPQAVRPAPTPLPPVLKPNLPPAVRPAPTPLPPFRKQAAHEPLYDWDGTIIPHLPGGAGEYVNGMSGLTRKQLSARAQALGDKPIDIATARPPLFHPAILATAKRLGINVRSIAHAPGTKVEHVRALGRPIIDNSPEVVTAVRAALGEHMAKQVDTHELDKTAYSSAERLRRLRERRGECQECGVCLRYGCDHHVAPPSDKAAALLIKTKRRVREEAYQDCPQCGKEWQEKGGPFPLAGDPDVYVCPHCDAELEFPEMTDEEIDSLSEGWRGPMRASRERQRERLAARAAHKEASGRWRPCRECGGEMRDHRPGAPPGQKFRGSVMCQACEWSTFGRAWLDDGEKAAAPISADALGDAAAVRAAASTPTEAQRDAGNYEKAHVRLHGLDIAIENPKGTVRSGVSKQGVKWSVRMKHHYGYIKGTKGADGDHVDVFIGPDPSSELVFIIEQNKPGTDVFDETKCVLGCTTEDEAVKLYRANYSSGWDGLRAVHPCTVDQFKWWLAHGDHSKPMPGRGLLAAHKKATAANGASSPPQPQNALTPAELRALMSAPAPSPATRVQRIGGTPGTGGGVPVVRMGLPPQTLTVNGTTFRTGGQITPPTPPNPMHELLAKIAVRAAVALPIWYYFHRRRTQENQIAPIGAAPAGRKKRRTDETREKLATITQAGDGRSHEHRVPVEAGTCAAEKAASWIPRSLVRLVITGPTGEVRGRLLSDTATTDNERALGMQKYAQAHDGLAMLFDIPGPYWPAKTAFDLDILFLDKTGGVLDVQAMPAAKTAEAARTLYRSRVPGAVAALEIASGWASARGVAAGDRVDLV